MKETYEKVKERPEIRVKIKGDAGIYPVWGIDWLNHLMTVERACGYESVSFDKIKVIEQPIAPLSRESDAGQREENEDEIDLSSPDYRHDCVQCGNGFWNKTKDDTICESCKSSITIKSEPKPAVEQPEPIKVETMMCMDCNKTIDKCDCVIYPIEPKCDNTSDDTFIENINRTLISQLEQKINELMDAIKERENQLKEFAETLYEVVQVQAKPINRLVNPMRVEGFEAGGNYVISLLKDYLYNKTE